MVKKAKKPVKKGLPPWLKKTATKAEEMAEMPMKTPVKKMAMKKGEVEPVMVPHKAKKIKKGTRKKVTGFAM